MKLVLVTPPTDEPVTPDELRKHLREPPSQDNEYIAGLGAAARQWAERYRNRAYMPQTFKLWLDSFPIGQRFIELPRPPLQGVTHVKYYDTADSATTFATTSYIVDSEGMPGRIVLRTGEAWPSDELRAANGVEIQFEAGYEDRNAFLDREAHAAEAIKQIVSHLYLQREAVTVVRLEHVPLGALDLLDADRPIFV